MTPLTLPMTKVPPELIDVTSPEAVTHVGIALVVPTKSWPLVPVVQPFSAPAVPSAQMMLLLTSGAVIVGTVVPPPVGMTMVVPLMTNCRFCAVAVP